VTIYKEQWTKLFDMADDIRQQEAEDKRLDQLHLWQPPLSGGSPGRS